MDSIPLNKGGIRTLGRSDSERPDAGCLRGNSIPRCHGQAGRPCRRTDQRRPDQTGVYKVGKPYQIRGAWYYPAVDYEYSETGIASWYGPKFHGRDTANGERFDMNLLTAAHRTLPLPSFVRVTNLDNGRSLVLRCQRPRALRLAAGSSTSRAAPPSFSVSRCQGHGTLSRSRILPAESRRLASRHAGGTAAPRWPRPRIAP